jgi:3-oxoacyl-[acyl-carrier-protein] synthase III
VHFIFGDGCVATILQQTNDSGFKIIDRKLVTKFSNNIRTYVLEIMKQFDKG